MRKLTQIVIHHSGTPRLTTVSSIKAYHTNVKGWSDIAYHYIVDGYGRLQYGRPIDKRGAHARGANLNSVGICITGDNTDPDQMWSQAQVRRAKELIAGLRIVFPSIQRVVGHYEVGTTATECPGVVVGMTLGKSAGA